MKWYYWNYDEDNAECLHCKGKCDVESSSLSPDMYHENKYTCRDCREYFIIYIFIAAISDRTIARIFEFSCGDYTVSLAEKSDTDFEITVISTQQSIKVPKFEIDLSDKDKLLKKFQLYFLFS